MTPTDRRGMILPLAIVAIAILGVASATGSFVERNDTRVADDARLHALAAAESELAAITVLDELASNPPAHLRIGDAIGRQLPQTDPALRTNLRVTRLGETLFSILAFSEMNVGRGIRARRANQLLARADAIDPPTGAAMASRDAPVVGSAAIDGRDEPGDADCRPASTDDLPTSAAPDSATLDSALGVLRSRATKRYPASITLSDLRPTVIGGRCDQTDARNWGDPSRTGACASYLPAVHSSGDLSVQRGVGQGVLIVDGDLEIGGAFEFAGLIVVGGKMTVVGDGARVIGGIVARSIDLSAATGEVVVSRSSCRVRRALIAAAPWVAIGERPWASVQ